MSAAVAALATDRRSSGNSRNRRRLCRGRPLKRQDRGEGDGKGVVHPAETAGATTWAEGAAVATTAIDKREPVVRLPADPRHHHLELRPGRRAR